VDRHAVIWTKTATGPIKMGGLVVTDIDARFAYSEAFLESGNPDGLSLLTSPKIYGREAVVFRLRPSFPLHPRLMQFIPGHGRNNIQRRLYTKALERRPHPPSPGFDTDWEILMLAGRNGIGHIDVFRDDVAAGEWYERPAKEKPTNADRSAFWKAIREDISEDIEEINPEQISQLLGPTPSAGGMIPKLLVAIPDEANWSGEFAAAGTRHSNSKPYVDVLLKIEPREYEGVVALESLCIELHRELGFEAPRTWHTSIDGMRLLAIERFDRDRNGLPIPMESFYSVFATGDTAFNGNEDTDIEEVGLRLEKLSTVVNLNQKVARREVYRRFCLAFCTGNGDMHLENLSFLGGPDKTRVAPVYDPSPMRAWPQHNVRSSIPIIFTDDSLRENILRAGAAFGLPYPEATSTLDEMLEATKTYAQRVMDAEAVPDERKRNLTAILEKERLNLMK
jgi:serine/threonine-protein kinase HipA